MGGKLIWNLLMISSLLDGAFGIIGGGVSPDAPHYVFIETKVSPPCGGTVVAPDVVLTAAHCLYDFRDNKWIPDNMVVVYHKHFTRGLWFVPETKWYRAVWYVLHPNYVPGQHSSDIAVIQLSRCLSQGDNSQGFDTSLKGCPSAYFARPRIERRYRENFIQLNWETVGNLVGMGPTQTGQDVLADALMIVTLSRTGIASCQRHFSQENIEVNEETHLCFTAKAPSEAKVTKEDLGATVFTINTNDDTICFLGVASVSTKPETSPNQFLLVTRADYILDWIRGVLNNLSHLRQLRANRFRCNIQ